jgi:hypothetical protein
MKVKRLNRVELLMKPEDIEPARKVFSDLLNVPIPPAHLLPEHHVLTTTCWEAGIELMGPGDAESVLHQSLQRKGSRGGIGPVVWEVDNVDDMRKHAENLGLRVLYLLQNENGGRQLSLASEDCYGYTFTFIEKPPGPSQPKPGSGARFKKINRVELLLPQEDVRPALQFMGRLLDIDLPEPTYLKEHHVLCHVEDKAGFEVFGPGDEESILHASLARKGRRGAIGPIVWEVDDLRDIREAAPALGHKILYEFQDGPRKQLSLSPETLFGYSLTFTQFV